MKMHLQRWCRPLWQVFAYLRQVSGDDAYERYLVHHHARHAHEPMLDRRAFYVLNQQRRWSGVQRCC